MASNYEQPKLATSKQYNVSQGNIGQVKQYTTDWSDYESAKIWEEVAKGTGKVNESIQESAKLRGMLDQTGNLVAQNSWLTEDSYNQGRAAVIAEQQKGTFLEIVDRTAREVSQKNGTMEDYNKAIEPFYQEYIKNIRNVATVDVNGNPLSIELQNETLVNARKEMVTYVALGQQKFQKIKEEQNAIDQQEINANIGNNLQYSMLMAANPADLTALMGTAYEQFRLKNSALGDPIKSRAISDGNFQVAVEAAIAQLDPMNPKDMQKLDIIKATINAPGFNLEPKVKQNIMEAAKKQTEAHNNLVNYNISGEINNLELAASMGQYKSGAEARIRGMIKSSMVAGKITPTEAASFENQINNMLISINKAALNSESSVLGMSATQAAAQFKEPGKHAEKVYAAFMDKADKAGGTVSDGQAMYAQWASSGWRATNPAYQNHLVSRLASDFTPYFPQNGDVKIEDTTLKTIAEQDVYKSQWQSMVNIASSLPGGANQIANSIPKEYAQAVLELSNRKELTGNLVEDMTRLQERRKVIDTNAASDKEWYTFNKDDVKATFLPWGGNVIQKSANFWNSASEGARGVTSTLINRAVSNPAVRNDLTSKGLMDRSSPDGIASMLSDMGTVFNTGDYAVVSTTGDYFANVLKGTALNQEGLRKYINSTAKDLKEKSGGSTIWSDRNTVFEFDGASLKMTAVDDTGRAILLPGGSYDKRIPVQEIKAALLKIQNQQPTPYAPLNSKGSNIKPNLAQVTAVVGSSQVVANWGNMMFNNEGEVRKPTVPNPKKQPDVVVIGQGVYNEAWPKEHAMIAEGYATNNRDLVNQGHTDVMVKLAAEAMPTIKAVLGNPNPETWSADQRAVATIMLDATWLGGGGGTKLMAEALRKSRDSGGMGGMDSFPKYFKEQLHGNYSMNNPLNDRGKSYAIALKKYAYLVKGAAK